MKSPGLPSSAPAMRAELCGHLGLLGFSVSLWDVEKEKVEALQRTGHMVMSGAVEGKVKIDRITGDICEAVRGADIIMVSSPPCISVRPRRRWRPPSPTARSSS